MRPDRVSMSAMLRRSDVALDDRALTQLWDYHRMLREANARLNLTRLHNFETMVVKHYVDSLLILKLTNLPSPIVDMGSGAGLPGIPLAIARPEVTFILADSRAVRCEFLRAVSERLGLRNVEVYQGSVGSQFKRPVEGLIARAVATIDEILSRAAHCVVPGGRVLLMKGPDCDDEIAKVSTAAFRLANDFRYALPGTPHSRRLIEYERLGGDATDMLDSSSDMAARSARDIQSASNPAFQQLVDVLSGRGIRKHQRALLAGAKIVSEVVARYSDRVEAWVTSSSGEPPPSEISESSVWLRLADSLFKQVDVSGTQRALVLVRLPEMPMWRDDAAWPLGCTLFVPFQDPENVGAVIRSAAAFGVARVVLLKEAAHPFHPKAARAAGPALFQVPLEVGPSLAELSLQGAPLFALSTGGQWIDDVDWPARFGLVAGLEGPGLPAAFAETARVAVPIDPCVESLNAATSIAIALYEWRRRSGLTKPTA